MIHCLRNAAEVLGILAVAVLGYVALVSLHVLGGGR